MKKVSTILCFILVAVMLVGCTTAGVQESGEQEATQDTTQEAAQDAAQEATQAPDNSSDEEDQGDEAATETVMQLVAAGDEDTSKKTTPWINSGYIENTLMWRALILADSDYENFAPDLAEYSVSDDFLTYTFTLRDGALWSDGEPITTDDVKMSVEHALRTPQINNNYYSAFAVVEGATAYSEGTADAVSGMVIEGNTITFKLERTYGNFLPFVSCFYILPNHLLGDENPAEMYNSEYWLMPVTNGMYKMAEFVDGDYYVLEKNPNFYGTQPKIDKVVVNFGTDKVTAASQNLFYYGSVLAVDPASYNEIGKMDNMKPYPSNTNFYRYFAFNAGDSEGNSNDIMADVRVRQAIMHAMDSEALAKIYIEGKALGTGVVDEKFVDESLYYDYDPELAKQMLNEAGFDFNQTLRIRYYGSLQSTADFNLAVASYLNQVGIKTDVQRIATDISTELYVTRAYDMAFMGLAAFDITEYYAKFLPNTQLSELFEGTEDYQDLYNQLLASTNDADRKTILAALQAQEFEDTYIGAMNLTDAFIYINTDFLSVPDDISFSNPWYRYDMRFEEWEIIG